MIEVAATIIITASSALLFGYWFRYTCLLILSAKTTRDFAGQVASANQLQFLNVQAQLLTDNPDLDGLHAALNRDYAVVSYLLSHVSDKSSGASIMEVKMLAINYKLMGAWYSVSRTFSATAARAAVDEMATIVAHFANTMGERAAAGAAA